MDDNKGIKLVQQFLADLSRDDIHKMIEASEKLKEDSKFDYRSYIGEGLYKYAAKQFGFDLDKNIEDSTIDEIVRTFITELAEMEDIDKLYDEIHSDIKETKENIHKAVQEFIENEEHYRKMMEVSLVEQAEKIDDPDQKKKMLDTSKAYTEGYKYTRLMEYIKSDDFAHMYKRSRKRFNVLDGDFSYVVQKVSGDTKVSLVNLRKAFKDCKNMTFDDNEIEVIVTALGMYARNNVDIKYNPDMWIAFCIYSNLMRLLTLPTKITPFDNEKIEYLKTLCEAATEFANNHKELM